MHYLIATRNYNYNPTASSSTKIEIKYLVGATPYTYTYTIPNASVNAVGIFSTISSESSGVGLHMTFNYTSSDYITITPKPTRTIVSIEFFFADDFGAYLPYHMGFSGFITAGSDNPYFEPNLGTSIVTYRFGAFRLPFNVDTGISRGNANIISQVSSEWETITNKTDGGTDITPLGVFNSYTQIVRGKRIKIINFPSRLLNQFDDFIQYISEDNTNIVMSSALFSMLFGGSSQGVYIDCSNTGDTNVLQYQEDLVEITMNIYSSANFRS